MTGPDFIWEHFQQDMETELQKWKDFPGFYGSWPPTGPGGGEDESLLSVYQKGLAAGTDPEASSYWGDLHNKDQRMVEMAAISYGILLEPEKLWEPLSEASKDHLADWLYQINLYSQADNNWHYFKVIVNLALKSVGKKWNPEEVKKAMDRYESFYLGNGWYSDGNGLRGGFRGLRTG